MKESSHSRNTKRRAIEQRRRTAGMTLLEMLGYIAVLAVLFNIAASAFLMTSRLSTKGTTALDRAVALEEVRAEFTETVRGASRIVPGVCSYRTGPDQVVLEMPDGRGEANVKHYTVLGFLGKEARVSRMRVSVPQDESGAAAAGSGESSAEMEGFDTYRLPIESLRFAYDGAEPAGSRLVTVTIDIKDDRPQGGENVMHRFSAALRGIASSGEGDAS